MIKCKILHLVNCFILMRKKSMFFKRCALLAVLSVIKRTTKKKNTRKIKLTIHFFSIQRNHDLILNR